MNLVDLTNEEDADNEGENENEFQEDESKKHGIVDLLACFWLSSHTLKTTVSGQTLTDTYAETSDSDCESNSYCDAFHLIKFLRLRKKMLGVS